MIYHFKSQKWLLFIVVVIAFTLLSCTTIPTKEFVSYKEAFNNCRTMGENVLLDYSVAVEEYKKKKALEEQEKQQAKKSKRKYPEALQRPRGTLKEAEINKDTIAFEQRMRAWDVVARYNDLLTALAEGRSVNELSAAVSGLHRSLSNFPIKKIADIAGGATPYIGAVTKIIEIAEEERTKQLFLAAVEKGGEKLENDFTKFLKEDAKAFYKIRYGQNDKLYERITDKVWDLGQQYKNLISKYKHDDKLKKLTDQINQSLHILDLDDLKIKQGNITYDEVVYNQSIQIKDEIQEKVAEARQKNDELIAYHKMMETYIDMIQIMKKSLQNLRIEAKAMKEKPSLPPTDELVQHLIELKRVYQIYQDKRRG